MNKSSLVVRKELQDQEIYVGDSCKLVCEFSKPVKVKWFFQGKKINTCQQVKKEHKLDISEASIENDGKYSCSTTHDNVKLNTSCFLNVKDETTMDMAQLQKEVRRLQDNLNNQAELVEEKEKERNEFAKKLLQLRDDHEKNKKELTKAKDKISLLNTEIQKLKSCIDRLEDTIKSHTKELEKREQQIQKQSNLMGEFLKYQISKEAKLDEGLENLKQLSGIVQDCTEAKLRNRALEEEKKTTETERCEANKIVTDLTEKNKDVEKQLETSLAEKNMAIQNYETAEKEKAKVVKERDMAYKVRRALEAQIEDLQGKKTTGCLPF